MGHIYQGRYKAILIQKESHLLEVCRYVVLNPMRAHLAEKPAEWQWSSYGATAGIEKPHPALATDWILGQFGARRKDAARRYGEFIEAGIGTKGIWKEVKGQSLLGDEGFAEEHRGYLSGQRELREIPRSQRHADRPTLERIFTRAVVGRKEKRDHKIVEAVEGYGYSQKEIADHLGLHYTTVSRIMNESIR